MFILLYNIKVSFIILLECETKKELGFIWWDILPQDAISLICTQNFPPLNRVLMYQCFVGRPMKRNSEEGWWL